MQRPFLVPKPAVPDLQCIQKLSDSGVRFYVTVPNELGGLDRFCSASEIELCLKDPEAFFAGTYGVTREEFREWIAAEFTATCSAETRRKQRCKNVVQGGFLKPIDVWLRLQGHYCDLHAGDRS